MCCITVISSFLKKKIRFPTLTLCLFYGYKVSPHYQPQQDEQEDEKIWFPYGREDGPWQGSTGEAERTWKEATYAAGEMLEKVCEGGGERQCCQVCKHKKRQRMLCTRNMPHS